MTHVPADPTIGQLKRFLIDRNVNLEACPVCKDKQDFGAESLMDLDDNLLLDISSLGAKGEVDDDSELKPLEMYCTNCGYIMNFRLRTILDWIREHG